MFIKPEVNKDLYQVAWVGGFEEPEMHIFSDKQAAISTFVEKSLICNDNESVYLYHLKDVFGDNPRIIELNQHWGGDEQIPVA